MTIRIISFTKQGSQTAAKIRDWFRERGIFCMSYTKREFCEYNDFSFEGCYPQSESPLRAWATDAFIHADALIFCCAAGIAVRAIAPLVFDKTKDPAVVVVDEKGQFVIPILSGHIGEANDVARQIAHITGGQAVITTATDINGLFAVDVFAKKNNLKITDMSLAKKISAELLCGEKVGFYSDIPFEGELPKELTQDKAYIGIAVTSRDISPYERTLHLVPQRYAVGMGCKRGKSADELHDFLLRTLRSCDISTDEIRAIVSIDIKADEQGLIELAKRLNVPFLTYSADELNAATGDFTESAFVESTTGTSCVCERAAALCSGGTPVLRKTAEDGKTLAVWEDEVLGVRF